MPVALNHLSIRAASFRHNTRVTPSAIRSGLGAGVRNSRVKISRTRDTVTAGVFPPESPPLPNQEPQRQQQQRPVVVPATPFKV